VGDVFRLHQASHQFIITIRLRLDIGIRQLARLTLVPKSAAFRIADTTHTTTFLNKNRRNTVDRVTSCKPYQVAWWPLARCVRDARVAQASVYVAVLVENENVSLVKSKDRTMVYPLFAVNPERGRRNYVTIFCFCTSAIGTFL